MEEPSNGQIIITWEDPRSAVAEAYRILRTNLQFASPDGAYSRSHGVPYVPFPTAGRSFPCTNSARRIQALLKAVNFAGSMSYGVKCSSGGTSRIHTLFLAGCRRGSERP